MRYPIPASTLIGVALFALPAGASAQAEVTPSLASPLATCISPKFGDLARAGSPFRGPDFTITFDTINLTGPPNSTGWVLRGDGTDSGLPFFRDFAFDADGRASVTGLPVTLKRTIGPGVPVRFTVRRPISDGGEEDPRRGPGTLIGTTKGLGLGVQVVGPKFPPPGVRPRPRSLVVSGLPFANKTLYGFLVEYKQTNRNPPSGDNAEGSRKVLRSFKLGKANSCGYLKTPPRVLGSKIRTGFGQTLYVNAGPKLDKARAVFLQVL